MEKMLSKKRRAWLLLWRKASGLGKEAVMKTCLVEVAWLTLARGTKLAVVAVSGCNLCPVATAAILSKPQFTSLATKPTCREITLYLEVSQL